ncbi:MAG TPA: hypothetical protein VGS41_12335, partial [Chthonomonadales bacterium]|nr:hypothetical protein [Chthonomonadales bacterium]
NGMGGFSQWVDNNLMSGATQNLGTTTGCYDAGRASGWQVAGAAANWGGNALMAATSFETGGESLEAEEGIGLLDEGATIGEEPGAAYSPANYEDLVEQAKQAYPNKADFEEFHHITPQYLGGARNGPTIQINAAYHQWITNAFRAEWSYGQALPEAGRLREILNSVYEQYPLPPGVTY